MITRCLLAFVLCSLAGVSAQELKSTQREAVSPESHVIHSADLNGDRVDDLLAQPRTSAGRVVLLFGSAGDDQAFEPQSFRSNRYGFSWSAEDSRLVLADLNDDGFADIIGIPYDKKKIQTFLASTKRPRSNPDRVFSIDSHQTFKVKDLVPGASLSDFEPHTGDFNGDGRRDLLLQPNSRDEEAVFLFAKKNGRFKAESISKSDLGVQLALTRAELHIGDFNGDGIDDVLVQKRNVGKKTKLVLVSEDLNTSEVVSFNDDKFGFAWNATVTQMEVVDFGNNGTADLIFETSTEFDPDSTIPQSKISALLNVAIKANGKPRFEPCELGGLSYGPEGEFSGLIPCEREDELPPDAAKNAQSHKATSGTLTILQSPCTIPQGQSSCNVYVKVSATGSTGYACVYYTTASSPWPPQYHSCSWNNWNTWFPVSNETYNIRLHSYKSTYASLLDSATAYGVLDIAAPTAPGTPYFPNVEITTLNPDVDTNGSYNVCWAKSANSPDTYEWQELEVGQSWGNIQSVAAQSGGGSQCFPQTKTQSSTTYSQYQYRVRAINGGGTSAWSTSPVVAISPTLDPPLPPVLVSGVENISGYPLQDYNGSWTHSWSAPSTLVAGYKYWRVINGNQEAMQTTTGTSINVSVAQDATRKSVVHNVGACVTFADCPPDRPRSSHIVEVRETQIPSVPSQINFSGAHSGSAGGGATSPYHDDNNGFTVSWPASTGTVNWYQVQRLKNGAVQQTYTSTATSWAQNGLRQSDTETFTYRVRANNYAGWTGWRNSSAIDVLPAMPSTPTGLSISWGDPDRDILVFQWTAPPNTTPTSYTVERRLPDNSVVTETTTAASLSKILTNGPFGNHQFRVRACHEDLANLYTSCSGFSGWVSFNALPFPPNEPFVPSSAQSNNFGDYTVTWTPRTGRITSYQLEESLYSGSPSAVALSPATAQSKSFVDRSSGSYKYRVKACNEGGCSTTSPWSDPIFVDAQPGVPTGLSVAPTFVNTAAVSWAEGSGASPDQYQLQMKIGSGSWSVIHSHSSTSASVGSASGDIHYFRVRACNNGECSGYSSQVSSDGILKPNSVVNLTTGSTYVTNIDVNWAPNPSGDQPTEYHFQEAAPNWAQIWVGPATSATRSPTGNVSFRVKACNGAGCSGWEYSNTAIHVPGIPANLAGAYGLNEVSDPFVSITWDPPTLGAATSKYELEQRTSGTSTWSLLASPAAASYSWVSPAPGSYEIRVRGCAGQTCNPDYSSPVVVAVANRPPSFLAPIGDQFSRAGESVVPVQVSAEDPDTDATLSFQLSSGELPPGVLVDGSTGILSGVVDISAERRRYSAVIEVSDGDLSELSNEFHWDVSGSLGSGLTRVQNVQVTASGPNVEVTWDYPSASADTQSGNPHHFKVVPLLSATDTLAGCVLSTQPQLSLTFDASQYTGADFGILACHQTDDTSLTDPCAPSSCGPARVFSVNSVLPLAGSVPALTMDDPNLASAGTLSWTDQSVDYYEISESGPKGYSQFFTERTSIDLQRVTQGDYQYRVKACVRDRDQGDQCSDASTAVATTVAPRSTPEPVVLDSNRLWYDCSPNSCDGNSDGRVFYWTLAPDIADEDLPDVFRVTFVASSSSVHRVTVSDVFANGRQPRYKFYHGRFKRGVYEIQACRYSGECSAPERLDTRSWPAYGATEGLFEAPQEIVSGSFTQDGGPDDLRPGEWWDEDRAGTGFSFYWASRLRYPYIGDSPPPAGFEDLFGTSYDLLMYWMTYRIIGDTYKPVWMFAQLKKDSSCPEAEDDKGCFKGTLYYPQDSTRNQGGDSQTHLSVGDARVYFGTTASQARVVINANGKGGLARELYDYNINYFGDDVAQGQEVNPADHFSGAYWRWNRDEIQTLHWIESEIESMLVLFYDDAGHPIWVRGDYSKLSPDVAPSWDEITKGPRSISDFKVIREGFDPAGTTPANFFQNGLIRDDLLLDAGSGGRQFFYGDDFNKAGTWVNLTLTDPIHERGASANRGTQAAPFSVDKQANLHRVLFSVGSTSPQWNTDCDVLTGDNCDLDVTWYSDGYFPESWARVCGVSTQECEVIGNPGTSWPYIYKQPETLAPGEYYFELLRGAQPGEGQANTNRAHETVIARSEIVSVNENRPPKPVAIVPSVDPTQWTHQRVAHDPLAVPMAGQPSVNGGSAQFSLPIVVPPGRAGMAPAISVSYSSSAGNGLLGMGWSISAGASSIHRCAPTVAQDGKTGSVTFTIEDRLCLDGQKLVLVDGPDYWANGAEFRTEIDSYARIRRVGSTYEVQTRDNRLLTYGQAVQLSNSPLAELAHKLTLEQDASGNAVEYHYLTAGNGEVLLDYIEYTKGFASVADHRRVEFSYKDRCAGSSAAACLAGDPQDRAVSYVGGYPVWQTKKLTAILTCVDPSCSEKVRRYEFDYELSDSTERLLLSSIKDCGLFEVSGAPPCKSLAFSWNQSGEAFQVQSLGGDDPLPMAAPPAMPSTCIGNSSSDCTEVVTCDGGSIEHCQATSNNPYVVSVGSIAGDFDGDGVKEVLGTVNDQMGGRVFSSLFAFDSEGNLKGDPIEYDQSNSFFEFLGWQREQLDVNGDGRTDLIGSHSGEIVVAYWDSSDTSWFSAAGCATGSAQCPFQLESTGIPYDAQAVMPPRYTVGDFNGDTKLDFVVARSSGNTRFFYLWLHTDNACGQPYCALGPGGLSSSEAAAGAVHSSTNPDAPFVQLIPEGVPQQPFSIDIDGNGISEVGIQAEVFAPVSQVPLSFLSFAISDNAQGEPSSVVTSVHDQSNLGLAVKPEDHFHVLMDVNGDGLSDFVYLGRLDQTQADPAGHGRVWTIQLNTGLPLTSAGSTAQFGPPMEAVGATRSHGAFPWNPFGDNIFTVEEQSRRWRPKYAHMMRPVDHDNDGRMGMLIPSALIHPSCMVIRIPSPDLASGQPEIHCAPEVGDDNSALDLYRAGGASFDASVYQFDVIDFRLNSTGDYEVVVKALNVRGTPTIKSGDLFGDGKTDFFSVVGCQVPSGCFYELGNEPASFGSLIYRNSQRGVLPGDYLHSVSDRYGQMARWTYRPLSSSSSTDGDVPFYAIPVTSRSIDDDHIYFTSSMYAVSAFHRRNAVGGENLNEYAYAEAMYNTKGRGFQGFKKVVSEQALGDENDLRTVSLFDQRFPLAGQLTETFIQKKDTTYIEGNDVPTNAIVHEVHQWGCRDATGNFVIDCNIESGEPTPSVTSGVFHVVPGDSTVVTSELDNPTTDISIVTTTRVFEDASETDVSGFDVYGNLTEIVVTTDDIGVREQKIRTVVTQSPPEPTDDGWWINKPLKSEQTVSNDYISTVGLSSDQRARVEQEITTTTFTRWNADHREPECAFQVGAAVPDVSEISSCSPTLPTNTPWSGQVLTYDQFGNRATQTVYASLLEVPRVSTTQYAPDGYFVERSENAAGHVQEYEVESAFGEVATQRTQIGNAQGQKLTKNLFDPFGMTVETFFPNSDGASLGDFSNHWAPRSSSAYSTSVTACSTNDATYCMVSTTDGSPVARKLYDSDGRDLGLRTNTLNLGSVQEYDAVIKSYNSRGQLSFESVPFRVGASTIFGTQYDYDFLGRVVEKREDRGDFHNGEKPLLVTNYVYTGLTTSITVSVGSEDSVGEITAETVCNPTDSILNDRLCVERIYASNGDLVRTQDAHGSFTRYYLDGQGNSLAVVDPDLNVLYSDYNALGHRISMDDPNMGVWAFTPNGLGEIESLTDAEGQVLNFEFDLIGRMTRRYQVVNQGAGLDDRWDFDVTGDGLLEKESRYESGILLYERDYSYDGNYRGIGHRTQAYGEPSRSFDYTVTVANDSYFGRPVSTTFPGNALAVYYRYDINGYQYQDGESADYGASFSGNFTGYLRHVSEFTPSGKPKVETFASGAEQTNEYYPWTWQMAKTTVRPAGSDTVISEEEYRYDQFQNIERRTSTAGGASESFTYDRLHRLKSSIRYRDSAPGDSIYVSYSYDELGNFSEKSDFGDSFVYGVNAGPNAVTGVTLNDGVAVTYEYDANGNRTRQRNNGAEAQTVHYDVHNLPTFISAGGTTSSFFYGAGNQRFMQVATGTDGGEIHYIDKLFEQRPGQNKHYLGNYAVWTTESASSNGLRFLHRDRLGSVHYISKEGPTLIGDAVRGFGPFGQPRSANWETSDAVARKDITTRGFTAHEHLDSLGLIHMNGRAYDFALGRFLSVDPVVQSPFDSQGLNPYSYILNNPLSGTDPTGYISCGASSGGYFGVGGGRAGGIPNCERLNRVDQGYRQFLRDRQVSSFFGRGSGSSGFNDRTSGNGASIRQRVSRAISDGNASPSDFMGLGTSDLAVDIQMALGTSEAEFYGDEALALCIICLRLGAEWHYARNTENEEAMRRFGLVGDHLTRSQIENAGPYGFKLASEGENLLHRNGLGNESNLKWTSKVAVNENWLQRFYFNRYGRYEFIGYPNGDGTFRAVDSTKNMGTLNLGTDPLSHLVLDMIPHLIWGNVPDGDEDGDGL